MNLKDAPNDTADLLYGMQAIADFLGIKRSVAYHLAATQRIPTFKVGRTVCAQVCSKERVPLRRLARTWIRPADDWRGAAFLAALKAHRLGHLKKKPQTPHEPGASQNGGSAA